MKTITPSIYETLRYPVALWYEDLEKLRALFFEVSTTVEIHTKTQQFEALNEILDLPKQELHELEFSILEPTVSLNFTLWEVVIYASKDTPIQRGLVEQIKAFLKTRRLRFGKVVAPISGLFVISFVVLGTSYLRMQTYWLVPAASAALVLCAAWYIRAMRLRFYGFSTIRPWRRSESPTFLERKGDAIKLIVITVIVTEAAHWIIRTLFEGSHN